MSTDMHKRDSAARQPACSRTHPKAMIPSDHAERPPRSRLGTIRPRLPAFFPRRGVFAVLLMALWLTVLSGILGLGSLLRWSGTAMKCCSASRWR